VHKSQGSKATHFLHRVVFVIAFPSAEGHQAAATLEFGNVVWSVKIVRFSVDLAGLHDLALDGQGSGSGVATSP
jgi:hypothetical protein